MFLLLQHLHIHELKLKVCITSTAKPDRYHKSQRGWELITANLHFILHLSVVKLTLKINSNITIKVHCKSTQSFVSHCSFQKG